MVLQAPCIHAGRSWDESTTTTVFSSGPQWSSLTRLNIQLTLKKYLAFCLQHQQKMFSFSFILKLMHAVPSTCLETATRLPRVGFRGGHKHLPEGVTNLGEVLGHRVRVWAFQKSGASKRKFFLISGEFIDSPETYIIGLKKMSKWILHDIGPLNQITLTFKLYEPIYYYVVSSYIKKGSLNTFIHLI